MQRMMIRWRGARCSGSGAVALNLLRASLTAVPFLASLAPCCADPAPIIHYAPGENLEHIDVALIDRAEREIDMAAYVLTDWPVMQALTRAADRGVAIRIYLDGAQLAEREPAKVFRLASRLGSNRRPATRCTSRATKSTGGCCAPAPRTFPHPGSSGRIMI